MALFDDLKTWLRGARGKAAAKATEVAAEQAVKQAKAKLAQTGDAFLGDAEAELERAREARQGRASVIPRHEDADAIAAKVLAAADESRASERALRRPAPTPPKQVAEAPPAPLPNDDPEARAREELARMKADLHARLYGDDASE